MSWRVVIVSKRSKLEYKLGYLVCRGEETKKVFIDEIATLIIESTGVSMTSALLCELNKRKVNVIFCDEKHNPQSQLLPLNGRHDASGMLKKQLCWSEQSKQLVWTQIVCLKIRRQCEFLKELNIEQYKLLEQYLSEAELSDITNREGHSAKVYFNALFGLPFKRGDDTFVNSALNYGYSVLLSAFNREIVSCGYNTQLGISHKNEFNHFNLSCDFIEPFRVLVDRFVFNSAEELSTQYKHQLCDILNQTVRCGGENCTVNAAIGIYCKSLFNALENGNIGDIKCYEL